ncbi:MAG: NADH-quinone oxidoreductase subunit L [Candidatus Sericytochromatia bacterium]|nr:NADH-quinone oxidoreductase subunit L [Candidatus Sericytochromatia bacterium]
MVQNAWLVAIFPLIAALLIFLAAAVDRKSARLAMGLSLSGTTLALLWSVGLLLARLGQPEQEISGAMRWLTAGSFDFELGWAIDNLSAMMLGVVTFISLLVQIYSMEYMAHEEGVARYYGALSVFTFSMLLLVLANNLLMLYAGWELVGVSSYLLIGFYTAKPEAGAAAKKAFIVNRIGDFGFLIGIMILFYMTGSLDFATVTDNIGKLPGLTLAIAAVLLFWGPIGKSAQFPLHVWLPDAMEGPTPVSALIHAATMVAAGIYMVAKLMPIFASATTPLFGSFLVLDFIALIGGVTALLAAAIAVTQTDIKRVLAYSTVSQLGFMMMALGMYLPVYDNGSLVELVPLGYIAGLFHLLTHAFFKAMLFLCAGSVIHAVHSNEMPLMGGLRKYMPVTALTCLAGTASISGLPFITAGFWSKDELLLAMWDAKSPLFWLAALAAVLTAFYMFRLYFMTFEGAYRGELAPEKLHDPGWAMKAPLLILAVPSLLAGFIGTPYTPKDLHIHHFLHYSHGHTAAPHHSGLVPAVLIVSLIVFVLGAGLAWAMYGSRKPLLSPEQLATRLKPLHEASLHRFYIDDAYNFVVRWLVMGLARISHFVDKYILDGMLVNGTGLFTIAGSETLKYTQTGRVQTYLLTLIIIVVLLLLAFFWLPLGKVI